MSVVIYSVWVGVGVGHGITESVWAWQRKSSPDSFTQPWTIKRKNLDPPKKTYKDEKIRADSSLISGLEDWEFAVPFYCVKDCRILCVPPHQQLTQCFLSASKTARFVSIRNAINRLPHARVTNKRQSNSTKAGAWK